MREINFFFENFNEDEKESVSNFTEKNVEGKNCSLKIASPVSLFVFDFSFCLSLNINEAVWIKGLCSGCRFGLRSTLQYSVVTDSQTDEQK